MTYWSIVICIIYLLLIFVALSVTAIDTNNDNYVLTIVKFSQVLQTSKMIIYMQLITAIPTNLVVGEASDKLVGNKK